MMCHYLALMLLTLVPCSALAEDTTEPIIQIIEKDGWRCVVGEDGFAFCVRIQEEAKHDDRQDT